MRQFFITVFATIVGIFLFVLLAFIFLSAYVFSGPKEELPDNLVLSLDLRSGVIDHSVGDSLFGATPNSVVDIVEKLSAAKTDDRVKGLFIRAGATMAPASAEEIRLALKDFKESGKFVVAHAQGFENTSFMSYHAISAADEIWQQDTTGFLVSGIRSETSFYGGVADKFGAEVNMLQFYEYKNAANTYKQTGFTEAHREATTSMLNSLYDNSITQIAEDRDMSESEVKRIFEGAPHSAEGAMNAGLVDKLGHLIDAKEYAKDKAGDGDTNFKSLADYSSSDINTGPVIAFIGGQGPVVMGGSSAGNNPINGEITMGGDTVSNAFEAAIKDDKVKAIVFRVSSPGGSPTASDQIHNATLRAQEAGKPVIISMGQYAASGGYYVSTHADKIVAMPSTITGSIGVLGGKIAFRETFAKVGYNIEAIDVGGNYVGVNSIDEPFTQAQLAGYTQQMTKIYEDFTGKVAEGRDMPIETVLEVAKGRVWTGEQAHKRGLVDELGGLHTAIRLAKEAAEIDEDTDIRLKPFPRPKSSQEQLMSLLNMSVESQQDLAAFQQLLESPEIRALIQARENLRQGQELSAVLPRLQ